MGDRDTDLFGDNLTYDDIKAATERTAGRIHPVTVAPVAPDTARAGSEEPYELWYALEFMQHTGSFKARGAQNFIQAHREAGTLPDAGVTIASGGNAGLACAWAAQQQGVRATVFLPSTAPHGEDRQAARLRGGRAAGRRGVRRGPEGVRGVRRLVRRARRARLRPPADRRRGRRPCWRRSTPGSPVWTPWWSRSVAAVCSCGVATAARHHGIRTVAVEPENCRALNAALEAGGPVDVPVDSVAVDSLGARRATALALRAARENDIHSVLVPDGEIVRARQALWDHRRVAVEHAAATALAALTAPCGGYRPREGERIAVVLCGANTDPSDLVHPAANQD